MSITARKIYFRVTMIRLLLVILLSCFWDSASAQQPLPSKMFSALRDSTTGMDIVILQGKGGSMSLDGRNVQLFNLFFENKPATKTNVSAAGNIMWLKNGREFISGTYYLGDSTGYVLFKKEEGEYINLLNAQGNSFLKSQIKN